MSAESNDFKFEVSTNISGELYKETTTGNYSKKGKVIEKEKGKKFEAQESE